MVTILLTVRACDAQLCLFNGRFYAMKNITYCVALLVIAGSAGACSDSAARLSPTAPTMASSTALGSGSASGVRNTTSGEESGGGAIGGGESGVGDGATGGGDSGAIGGGDTG